jgi:hypothetical protein
VPPVEITIPSKLLTFFASVAVGWTLASLVTVLLALRALLALPREYASKHDLDVVDRLFEEWIKDVERRHRADFDEARDHLQQTITTLSQEIHGLLGELRAQRRRRVQTSHRPPRVAQVGRT